MIKQKIYCFFQKLHQPGNLNKYFELVLIFFSDISSGRLFLSILILVVLVTLHFFLLTKLLQKRKLFLSVIANVPASNDLLITQLADHNHIRLISQLISGISGVIQKLFSCFFNGTSFQHI